MANTRNNVQLCYLLEKCKSKPQWRITSHQSEWPSKSLKIINAGEGVEKKRTLLHRSWQCKLEQPLWRTVQRTVQRFFMKLKNRAAIWSNNPISGLYPEKMQIQKVTCTLMSLEVLFTIAQLWKQNKCPSIDKWMKNMCVYTHTHIHTMEYYPSLKKNE